MPYASGLARGESLTFGWEIPHMNLFLCDELNMYVTFVLAHILSSLVSIPTRCHGLMRVWALPTYPHLRDPFVPSTLVPIRIQEVGKAAVDEVGNKCGSEP